MRKYMYIFMYVIQSTYSAKLAHERSLFLNRCKLSCERFKNVQYRVTEPIRFKKHLGLQLQKPDLSNVAKHLITNKHLCG